MIIKITEMVCKHWKKVLTYTYIFLWPAILWVRHRLSTFQFIVLRLKSIYNFLKNCGSSIQTNFVSIPLTLLLHLLVFVDTLDCTTVSLLEVPCNVCGKIYVENPMPGPIALKNYPLQPRCISFSLFVKSIYHEVPKWKSWKWAKQKLIQYEAHLKMAGFLLNFGTGSKRLFICTFWDINSYLPNLCPKNCVVCFV